MKVYTIQFNGYYPVGACMVITAENEYTAHKLAIDKLKALNLESKNSGLSNNNLVEVDTCKEDAIVLLDGDY